jgi:hypothetical protein
MMLLFGLMFVCMKNMDPEEMKKAQEQQGDLGLDQSDPFGSIMKMLAASTEEPAAGAQQGGGAAKPALAAGGGGAARPGVVRRRQE